MTLPDDWWTTGLEDEPCGGCGVVPSKHQGHGSFICKTCYDEQWCPKCRYRIYNDHVCVTTEEHRRRHVEHAILFLSIDEACDALHLAEELTRSEPDHETISIPFCSWCGSDTSKDGERFDHKPECKWKRFRQMVDPDEGRELGSS